MSSWIVTNIDLKETGKPLYEGIGFKVFADGEYSVKERSYRYILSDGYYIPVSKCNIQNNEDFEVFLFNNLTIGNYDRIINSIKGNYNILFFDKNGFKIANDKSGLGKFFYFIKDNKYIISNNLKKITNNLSCDINIESATLFVLLEHFAPGHTLFNDVFFSTPASLVTLNDARIIVDKYYDTESIANFKPEDYSFEEISIKFRDIIKSYIDFLRPKDISLTITGGNDSRMVLAALVNLDIKPNLFSFGNPESYDCVVAKGIANHLGLKYSNYNPQNTNINWLNSYKAKIEDMGNSLINIHRSHRLFSVEEELKNNSNTEMIFTGLMGGDYIRGINFDDYITPKLVRLWWTENKDKKEIVRQLLKERFLKIEKIDIDKVMNILSNLSFLKNEDYKKNEVLLNTDFIGPIHDYQDTSIFSNYVKFVANIFMDIDFLEMLFSTKHNMLYKEHTSNNFFKRINDPELACNVINILCPKLSSIGFAKNYSPKEFLGNKLVYSFKRMVRRYSTKTYPPNYPYLAWYRPFVKEELQGLNPEIKYIINYDNIITDFNTSNHGYTEKYWHKYTNVINLSNIAKKYK